MAPLALELSLHPDDLTRLLKFPGLSGGGARPTPVRLVWHDTPEGALAGAGLSVAERTQRRGTLWRRERMRPAEGAVWAPGTPAPLDAEAPDLASLPGEAAEKLLPVVGFDGQSRLLHTRDGVAVTLLSGGLHAVSASREICRVTLEGEAGPVGALALSLAGPLRLEVPAVTLAAEAIAAARPAPRPRRLGAPSLPAGLTIDAAFAFIVAHLLDVILHYAPLARSPAALAGESPEPVHQMRVAIRRLRSAFSLFRGVAACPALDEAAAALKAFGQVLGPARDWDVFGAGTCAQVLAGFPGDAAVARMAVQARRRREAGYAALVAYLDDARFRRLGLGLALLAAALPWRDAPPAAPAGDDPAAPAPAPDVEPPPDLVAFAARALSKRMKRLVAPGAHITDLPVAELHAIRLNGKRLRYAAEFFAPLFPGRDTRRFLRRMTALQERLGHLNDGNVAAGLMAEIGQTRGYAGGVVRGFVAAGSADARGRIGRSWKRFRKQAPFWQ